MNLSKKQIRATFRNSVFERDRYLCKCCKKPGKDRQGGDGWKKFHAEEIGLVELDAHHITNRSLLPNGGYVKENGVSVCNECHLKAESFSGSIKEYLGTLPAPETDDSFAPDSLYKLIGSSLVEAIAASNRLGVK